MRKTNPSKGFVTVASKRKQFLMGADNLKESILDYYPEAKITLFTEQRFIDDPKCQIYFQDFDQVIATPAGTSREKMWGMANSPYDLTFYMDADIEIRHEDIKNVFDHLEDGKYDMVYVNLTKEGAKHFAEWNWGPNLYDEGWRGVPDHLAHCGGVALYDMRNPLIKEFMMDWYKLHLKQVKGEWNPPEFDYIKKGNFRRWDQLTLWWLIYHCPKYRLLKWKFFEDNYRWNYFTSFMFNKDGTHNCHIVDPKRDYWKTSPDPVVVHFSSWMDKYGDKGYL
jgi:glutathione peroxidase-family protein